MAHPLLAKLLPEGLEYEQLRITPQHSMNTLIERALKHLQSSSSPIVLHTLPAPPASGPATSTPAVAAGPAPAPAPQPSASTSGSKQKIPTNSSLPKLISCAEIIKRSWIPPPLPPPAPTADPSVADGKGKGKGKKSRSGPKPVGLHQYTLLCSLEEHGLAPSAQGSADDGAEEEDAEHREQRRQQEVVEEWITGGAGKGKRPRMRHTPLLVLLLSPSRIDAIDSNAEVASKFSYQPPLAPPKKRRLATEQVVQAEGSTASEVGDAAEEDAMQVDEAAPKTKSKRKRRRPAVRSKVKRRLAAEDGAAEGGAAAGGGGSDVGLLSSA